MRHVGKVQVLVLAVATALSLASANQPQQPAYGPSGQVYSQDPTGCDIACNHYYQCKGIADAALVGQCTYACQAEQPNAQQTYQFAQLPCDQAIALIEQGGGGMQGGSAVSGQPASPGGPRPGDKECEGCKRWDDLCQYVVETAVGSGPYSGMVTDCPQSCCP
jgi:hypothetical protein